MPAVDGGDRFREAGLTVEPVIVSGNPADEIVRIAESRQASLIVVGAHGRTSISEVFLGLGLHRCNPPGLPAGARCAGF